jgi:hypothetical protein
VLADPQEMATRTFPISREEIHWARRRPEHHRTPIPSVGDRVWYRHLEWAEVLWRAEVLAVQSMHEEHPDWGHPREDANMWIFRADVPLVPDGRTALGLLDVPKDWYEPHPDPWPVLRLRVYPPNATPRVFDTREARLRGAAGWLPPDWQARHRPRPSLAPAARAGLVVATSAPARPPAPAPV